MLVQECKKMLEVKDHNYKMILIKVFNNQNSEGNKKLFDDIDKILMFISNELPEDYTPDQIRDESQYCEVTEDLYNSVLDELMDMYYLDDNAFRR